MLSQFDIPTCIDAVEILSTDGSNTCFGKRGAGQIVLSPDKTEWFRVEPHTFITSDFHRLQTAYSDKTVQVTFKQVDGGESNTRKARYRRSTDGMIELDIV